MARGLPRPIVRIDRVTNEAKRFDSAKAAGIATGVDHTTARAIANRRRTTMRYTFAWADEYDAAKDYRGGVVLEVMGIKAWYPCISHIYKRFGNPDPHKLAALLKSGETFSIYTSKGELEGCRVRRNGGIGD